MDKKSKQEILNSKTMTNMNLIKKFLPYYKKYSAILVFDLFCASMTTVCELALPLIIRQVTQIATTDIKQLTIAKILAIVGVYFLLRVIDAAANYYMNDTGHVMGAKIETDMRRDLFAHLQRLSYSFFDNTKIGQLMARMTSDLFDITEFSHHCPEEFFIAGFKITISFIILLHINIPLTLIMFAVLPLMIFCTVTTRKKMRSVSKASRSQIGEINAQVEDSLLGIRVVKSFANEKIEKENFKIGNHKFLDIKTLNYKYLALFQTTIRIFHGAMYVVVIFAGSLFLIYNKITIADFTAYILYINTLMQSIRKIADFAEQFQKGMTGVERFVEIMEEPITIKDSENALELCNVAGNIVFDDVSFKYSENKSNVLSHININIPAGDNLAIVGPSGGGKTTLCNLIPRFYETTGGSITIDGINIKDIKLTSLRNNIGIVQQDVYLFSGTILENIEYGKPGANRIEIIEAAKKAGAYEFISQLPHGFDSYVGERGIKLSGGQKQRISIARVFLKNPPILILDEATSALDNESELLIQQSLEELTVGRTTITIAHRLTTIVNAKEILVLTYNGIAEKGSHQELIDKRGVYYGLYKMYEK